MYVQVAYHDFPTKTHRHTVVKCFLEVTSTCCALLHNRVVIQAVCHNTVRHQSIVIMVLSTDIKHVSQKVRYPEIQSSHLRVNVRASGPCNSGQSTLALRKGRTVSVKPLALSV